MRGVVRERQIGGRVEERLSAGRPELESRCVEEMEVRVLKPYIGRHFGFFALSQSGGDEPSI